MTLFGARLLKSIKFRDTFHLKSKNSYISKEGYTIIHMPQKHVLYTKSAIMDEEIEVVDDF